MKEAIDPIFIVDDDLGILESFDAILGDDYPLVMIDNGVDAVEKIADELPRLVFLDLKIPGQNGIDVLSSIRRKGIVTHVVVVTALPGDQYQQMAEKHGVYRYLRKPLDVDEVQEIARSVLN